MYCLLRFFIYLIKCAIHMSTYWGQWRIRFERFWFIFYQNDIRIEETIFRRLEIKIYNTEATSVVLVCLHLLDSKHYDLHVIQIYYDDDSTLFDAEDYRPLIDINSVMIFLCNKTYNISNRIIVALSQRNYNWVQFM